MVAAGVALGAIGGAGVARATPGWWRLASVPVLAVATLVAVWTLGQAVAATNVPTTTVGTATPADYGLRYREVTFRTSDGVRLAGWYIPSRNGGAVALAHGAGSTRSSVLQHAVVLARHGYGVVLFDARGHGDSEGRAMDFGWYGDADVSAAVSFLRVQTDVDSDRLAAVGMSMGGEEVIGAAASDARIAAVVAEGATVRVAADRDWLSREFGVRGWLQEQIEWLTFALADVLTDADRPIALRDAVLATYPRPVLLIASGTVGDEVHAASWVRSGSPDTVDVWVADGAGHTDALSTHPEEWTRRVTSFLDAALGAGDAH